MNDVNSWLRLMSTNRILPLELKKLDAEELKELVSPGHHEFLPNHVAERLDNRKPAISIEDGAEMEPLLAELISAARESIENSDTLISSNSVRKVAKLKRQEVDHARTLSILLPYYSHILVLVKDRYEEGLRRLEEALLWAGLIEDARREAIIWNAYGPLHRHQGEEKKERESYQKAFQMAKTSFEDPVLELVLAGNLAHTLIAHKEFTTAYNVLTEVIAKKRKELSQQEEKLYLPPLLLDLATVAASNNQTKEALLTLLEARDLAQCGGKSRTYISTLNHLGRLYRYLEASEQNIECQQEIIKVSRKERYDEGLVRGYGRLAEACLASGDTKEARQALQSAQRHITDQSSAASLLVQLQWMDLCLQQGNIAEGLQHSTTLLDLLADQPFSFATLPAWKLYGRLLMEKGDLAASEEAFRQALGVREDNEEKEARLEIRYLLAYNLFQQNRIEEASAMLDKIIAAEQTIGKDSYPIAAIYSLKGEILAAEGKYGEALECTRKGGELALQVERIKAREGLHKATILSEVELSRTESLHRQEQQQQAEQSLTTTLIAFEGQRNLLNKVEQQLQKTLSFLEEAQVNEVMYVLKDTLSELQESEVDKDQHPLAYLQSIDQDFFVRLRAMFPNITRKQERLCGLIRAGLTSKEISSILNLTYEGMRAQRKRLRKRLQLDPADNLERIISEL